MFSVFMLQYFLFFCPLPHLGRVMLPPLPPHSLQLMDAQSSESVETEENSKLGLRLIWQGMSIGALSYLLRTILVCLTRCCDIYILNLIKIRPVREYNLERTCWYLLWQTTAPWQSKESTSYREPLGETTFCCLDVIRIPEWSCLPVPTYLAHHRPALYSDAKLSSGTKNQENEWCHRSSKKKSQDKGPVGQDWNLFLFAKSS